MVWQDIIISFANLVFAYSLLYQVVYGFKTQKSSMTLQTSVLTTLGLYAMVVAFFSLGLYFSTIVTTFNATMWLLLWIQAVIYKR